MRRYTRNRLVRFVGKFLLWAALIIAIPATVSLFKPFGWQHRLRWWRFCDGCFDVRAWRTSVSKRWTEVEPDGNWWFRLPEVRCYGIGWPEHRRYLCNEWYVPLYPVAAMLSIGGIAILYSCPFRPHSYCQKCGYDLKGNESGFCPECGEAVFESIIRPIDFPAD